MLPKRRIRVRRPARCFSKRSVPWSKGRNVAGRVRRATHSPVLRFLHQARRLAMFHPDFYSAMLERRYFNFHSWSLRSQITC
jgi:hypothetical protein